MELLKMLNHKYQKSVLLISPPKSFEETSHQLEDILNVQENLDGETPVQFVIAFFREKNEIKRILEKLMPRVTKDALLWLCYPKKSSKAYKSDITRDSGWEAMGDYSYEPVRQISIDEDWSALRFRPIKEILKFNRSQNMALSQEGKKKAQKK